jgi:mannose-6-phosphate isomerase-like protein (cupin superfamily)
VADVSTTRLDLDTVERMTMLGEQLGLTSFGLRQIVLRPGQRNRVHRHRDQEEVYVVLRGRLTIRFDDGERELGEGEVARVPPPVRRQLSNEGDEPCAILAIGAAGTHERGDGEAFLDWDDTDPKPPPDVPLPD